LAGPRLPVERAEVVRREPGRRRQVRLRRDHLLDVVVQREHLLLGVERVEPDRPPVEQHQDDVRERARPEAAALRQVDGVAQLPPLPLVVVELARHAGVATFDVAAASPMRADQDLPDLPRDVDELTVHACDEVARPAATPIAGWADAGQNSTPFCALTPAWYGCLTTFISVTRSANSTSSGGASRPVITTCWKPGRFRSTSSTSSSGIHPNLKQYVSSSSTMTS